MLSSHSPFYCAHCIHCRLPNTHCVCGKLEKIELPFNITLCCHSNEWQRQDNTGQWAFLSSHHIQRIRWHRKPELITPSISINQLAKQAGHYLLFPSEEAIDIQQLFSEPDSTLTQSSHPPLSRLWVIDGTWQEAQKMLRQSPWLTAMPKVKIKATKGQSLESRFQLRRNQQGLCTMEAIEAAVRYRSKIAALNLNNNFSLCQDTLLDLLR